VRAYAQTTGMWVRAALREDHGLDVEDFSGSLTIPRMSRSIAILHS